MAVWMKKFNNEFTKDMNLRIRVFHGEEEKGILFLNTLEHRRILNPAQARRLRDILRGKATVVRRQTLPNWTVLLLELDDKHEKMMKRKREAEEVIKKVDGFMGKYESLKRLREDVIREFSVSL